MRYSKHFIQSSFLILFSFLNFSFFAQDWPMVGANKERTSWNSSETELYPPFKFTDLFPLNASFISTYDGILYLAESPNIIRAVDSETLSELWSFEIDSVGGGIGVQPAVGESMIYCGGQGGLGLYALDRMTGTQVWFKEIGNIYSRCPILDDSRLFIVQDSLYCLDAGNGSTIWTQPIGGQLIPTVDESNVYICHNGFSAYNKLTGELVWNRTINCQWYVSIMADEKAIYGNSGNQIVALNKSDGNEIWSFEIPSGGLPYLITNAMAVSDKVLSFAVWDNGNLKGQIFTLDKNTGAELWHYTYNFEGSLTPAIANGVIYSINWEPGTLYAFDETEGDILFKDTTRRYLQQPIIANSQLLVSSNIGLAKFEAISTGVGNIEFLSPFKHQSSPNPMGEYTVISFEIPVGALVNLDVYDIHGNTLAHLVDEFLPQGKHEVEFDTRNIPVGSYFYVISINDIVEVQQMLKME